MKLLGLILAATSLAQLTAAQYFSQGWQPGQSVSTVSAASAAYTPVPAGSASASETMTEAAAQTSEPAKPFSPLQELKKLREDLREKIDPTNLLQAKPVAQLFEKAGVNISEKVELAKKKSKLWDENIPLITDENWGEMVVNETLTPEEQKERVWFVVITTAAQRRDGIAKMVDEQFDLAYNLTAEANDLPHVRFARIDYINVTTLTTKWAVWRAPQFVVIKDRGQTLYFYKAQHISPRAEQLREFLREKGYAEHEPWNTSFAPGGDNEWMMDLLARTFKTTYTYTSSVPQWLLMLASGTVASLLIRFFHSTPAPAAPAAAPTRQAVLEKKFPETVVVVPESPVAGVAPSTPTKSKSGAKKRGGKR